MHPRTSVLSTLGSVALALLAACATSRQQPPPDGSGTPPPMNEPVTTPPPPGSSSDASPWQRARVGDRVVYSYSANRKAVGGQGEARTAGQLSLEVVAVQPPWVWLKLSFQDVAARPMSPLLAQELVLPVRMDATRPLDVPREGTESAEQPSAAGRTWEAKRYLQDNRPSDGPLVDRLYAVSPGPLYLTHGLLSASNTLSGFGASGGSQLTLVQVQQGAEGAPAATPPSMQHPLGPGTWYDFSINSGSGDEVQRSCLSTERGHVLIATGPAPAPGGAPCSSFAEAAIVPLEEVLLTLITESLELPGWPPRSTTPMSRGTLTVQGRGIPALTRETPEAEGTTRQIRYETYAAEPWSTVLDGLDAASRFGPLAEGVDGVDAKGQRKPTFTKKLVGWGSWLEGTK